MYQSSLGFHGIGNEMYWQWAIGLIGILRFCWIGLKWHRTGYSMAPVWFVLAFLALVFVFAEISALNQQTF